MISPAQFAQFRGRILTVLDQASQKFNIPEMEFDVDILFDLRGQCAGQAQMKCNQLILRFNTEAIAKDWDDMLNDTIPHEVAHLVCFKRPELGCNHDDGWKAVTRALGGTGKRTHNTKLSYAKKVTRHIYILDDGTEVSLTSNRHKKIQSGYGGFFMRPAHTNSRRKEYIESRHYRDSKVMK